MEKIRVLYIDDERINLLALKSTFRTEFDIFTAIDTIEASQILEREKIHVVFADQRMPNKTGVEFFEEIKEVHPNPIRVLVTAYSDIQSVIDGINKGSVYKYIKKPWDVGEVRLVIQEAYQLYLLKEQNEYLRQKYKELFYQSSDPILLVNPDGIISECNESAENFFAKSVPTLRDTSIRNILTEMPTNILNMLINPESHKEFVAKLRLTKDTYALCLISRSEIKLPNSEHYIQLTIKDISKREEFKRKMLKAIYETQDSERERISRDLHDSLGQVLAAVKLKIDTVSNFYNVDEKVETELNRIVDLLRDSIDEVNTICYNSLPPSLYYDGLNFALGELTRNFNTTHFEVVVEKKQDLALKNPTIEVNLFRIIQEFTNNSILHGKAKKVTIIPHLQENELKITLQDDGIGFDTNILTTSEGKGIKGILSRATVINAELDYTSSKEKGTQLVITVPLPSPELSLPIDSD